LLYISADVDNEEKHLSVKLRMKVALSTIVLLEHILLVYIPTFVVTR